MSVSNPNQLLEANSVSKAFVGRRLLGGKTDPVEAVKSASLGIGEGEIVGLAGESGSGKSTLASIMAGMDTPTAGTVTYQGNDVHRLKGAAKKAYQRKVQFVLQDPFDALSPRLTVRQCVEEPLVIQKIAAPGESDDRVSEAMAAVGMTPAGDYLGKRPWQLSGGQRQRVAIARALITEPELIIADEPVSMLDVSLRAGVLEVFARLRSEFGVSILYISHDFSTIRQVCDRLFVMWQGELVESGPTRTVIDEPTHPYTRSLIAAAPRISGTYVDHYPAGSATPSVP